MNAFTIRYSYCNVMYSSDCVRASRLILTCHGRETTGITNYINYGLALFICQLDMTASQHARATPESLQ